MPDKVAPKLRAAMELALELHGQDSRKRSPVPVLAHLFSVCALVQHDGGSEDDDDTDDEPPPWR